MATRKKTTQTETDVQVPAGAGSVDQIRDILFGPQIRGVERNIERLEDRLAKEAADLRGDFKQRLEALESFARDEIDAVGQTLATERKERAAAIDAAGSELKALAKDTDERLAALDEKMRKAHKELRKLILDQSKSLGDDIQNRHDSLSKTLDREVSDLGAAKVDREGLAALLTELALRIKGEPLLPDPE